MSNQHIKNAKDPEDLDELLDFSNKSYRDYKSKKSGLEINFPLLYGHIRNRVVFFATPCIFVSANQGCCSSYEMMVPFNSENGE